MGLRPARSYAQPNGLRHRSRTLIHPVLAAKQAVTADHVGQGRFGLNIVCGWNEDEFGMFGAHQQEHDARYEYGQEWWEIIRRLWAGEDRSITKANSSGSNA
jgi:alkanesulfonate monooxygenase SsuD/methylene tetrahydromethanopterin reductase-like flavin-dependent oxidoreductase (luciferase family)